MPALDDSDATVTIFVIMFLQTLKLFINFCFQSSLTPDCCRTERQIQQEACRGLSTHCTCLATRLLWLKRNNVDLITVQIWMPWDVWEGRGDARNLLWNIHPKPRNFWIL